MSNAHENARVPKLCRHRLKGRPDLAYTRLPGIGRIGLGRWGTPESKREYRKVITEWLSSGGLPVEPEEVTVADLTARFMRHAEEHYRRPDGTQTGEVDTFRTLQAILDDLYGDVHVADFGPSDLKIVRDVMIERGWTRKSINHQVRRIVHIWKWGVEQELVRGSVHEDLRAVAPLKRGRSKAKESKPVKPVPQQHIDAVREHVSSPVRALIDLQLLTAARPGELLGLRAIDIDTSRKVWIAKIENHKTSHHGRDRDIFIGPRGQRVLEPFMSDRPVDAFLFSPREGHAEVRRRGAKGARRPNQKPSPRETDREIGDRYTTDSYRKAIHRGCRAAKVPTWGPHRLRHSAGTELRKEFGVEGAQLLLGHAHLSATEIYAELNRSKAVQIAAKVG